MYTPASLLITVDNAGGVVRRSDRDARNYGACWRLHRAADGRITGLTKKSESRTGERIPTTSRHAVPSFLTSLHQLHLSLSLLNLRGEYHSTGKGQYIQDTNRVMKSLRHSAKSNAPSCSDILPGKMQPYRC